MPHIRGERARSSVETRGGCATDHPPAGIEDLPSKLDSANPDTVYTFAGVNPYIPDSAEHDVTALRSILGTARSVKTSGEIEMIRAATDITAEEHKLVMRNIKCGEYESDAESLFRFIGHNYGARFQSCVTSPRP